MKQWFIASTLALVLGLGLNPAGAEVAEEEADATVSASLERPAPPFEASQIYVIPVQGTIDPAILYVIRRGIKEAIDSDADAVILHMDTYGGRVDSTDDIYEILKRFPDQDRLVTFIDDRAGSAGSFISAATAHIYMAPSSVIGAADVVMMSPQGAVDVPEDYQEKLRSFVRGIVRATAERQGHNPDVFEAMIDPNLELKIGEDIISEKEKLLTLTNLEAEKMVGDPPKPLLSRGTFRSIEDLTDYLGQESTVVTTIEPSGFERIAQFIVMISPFLISAAFLLGYAEFQTQGFGVLGALAVLCIVLFFFGHAIAGLTGHVGAVLFFVGLALLIVEAFVLPGTFLFGTMGAAMMVSGLLKTMIDYYPGDPVIPSMPQLQVPVVTLAQSFLITAVGILLMIYLLPRTRTYHQIILDSTAGTTTSSPDRPVIDVGASGTAQTTLRPSGRALLNNEPVDVVTDGEFLEVGTPIRVVEVRGSTIIVEAA